MAVSTSVVRVNATSDYLPAKDPIKPSNLCGQAYLRGYRMDF